MSLAIVFESAEGTIAVGGVAAGQDVLEVAKTIVPTGKPFLLVDSTNLPTEPQEAWEVDFSNPTGYGE